MTSSLDTNSSGSGGSIDIRQSFGTTNYVIAVDGTYPSRNLSTNPLLGSVAMFAGNFAPRGWAVAAGQLVSINQNSALFSLLGTNYGGDGRSTFGLPDFRGRAVVGSQNDAQGSGLSAYRLGTTGGRETVNLISNQLPAHNHSEPSLNVPTLGESSPVMSFKRVDLPAPFGPTNAIRLSQSTPRSNPSYK